MRFSPRAVRALTAIALLAALPVLTAAPASAAGPVQVTSGADTGPGSFRAAVDAANADPRITTITFATRATVELTDEVRFTGPQDLTINGTGATVSGASIGADTDTWDSGLFVAAGGGDLSISRLTFADSFNNGVAVFVPEGTGKIDVDLDRVVVTDAQFHGVLVDGQSTTGYNTDDVIHPACTDPYAVDAGVTIDLDVSRTVVTGSGRLDDYDFSLATGCPQDFDGLRVDQGGTGDIVGSIERSNFDTNLADGVELDEKGDGDVDVVVSRTTFDGNGDTASIECTTGDGCDLGDTLADLDDGFDIDEEGDGDLVAHVSRSTVDANFDEGLDFDEAGEGSIVVTVERVTATGNNDEALKASEEDGGDIVATISRSSFLDGGDDGTQIEEFDDGDVDVTVERSTVTGNGNDGVKVEQADDGSGSLRIDRSDLRDNDDDPVDTDGIDDVQITRTEV